MKQIIFLSLAILLEVTGSTSLKFSDQFTKWIPSVITIGSYISAFYLLSLSLKTIPLGIAYAVWAGVGIVLTSLVGIFLFKQYLSLTGIIGIALILAGAIIANLPVKMPS